MEESLKSKMEQLKNNCTLNNMFSEQEQKALGKKSIAERLEIIVKGIFQNAEKLGIPVNILKTPTNNFDFKTDKMTGEMKARQLSAIESLAKKLDKELQNKLKKQKAEADKKRQEEEELEIQKLPETITLTFSKGFIDEVLKAPDKLSKEALLTPQISEQLKNQMPERLLNEPWEKVSKSKNISLKGSGLNMKIGGKLTVLEVFVKSQAEIIETMNKKMQDKMKANNVTLGNSPVNDSKPNEQKKEEKPKDMVSVTTDHINDMVLPGETTDYKTNGENSTEAAHTKQKDLKDMTPDEEIALMQEMGMVPPWLKKD